MNQSNLLVGEACQSRKRFFYDLELSRIHKSVLFWWRVSQQGFDLGHRNLFQNLSSRISKEGGHPDSPRRDPHMLRGDFKVNIFTRGKRGVSRGDPLFYERKRGMSRGDPLFLREEKSGESGWPPFLRGEKRGESGWPPPPLLRGEKRGESGWPPPFYEGKRGVSQGDPLFTRRKEGWVGVTPFFTRRKEGVSRGDPLFSFFFTRRKEGWVGVTPPPPSWSNPIKALELSSRPEVSSGTQIESLFTEQVKKWVGVSLPTGLDKWNWKSSFSSSFLIENRAHGTNQ